MPVLWSSGSAADQKAGKPSQIQTRYTKGSFLITHHQNKSWNATTWRHTGQPQFQTGSIFCCAACLWPCALQTPRLGNMQPPVIYSWPCCSRAKHFQPSCKCTSSLSSSHFWLLQAALATRTSDRCLHSGSVSVYCCSSCTWKVNSEIMKWSTCTFF